MLATLIACNCLASDRWSHISDSNFDVYSTDDRKRAEVLLGSLERTRSLLQEVGLRNQSTEFQMRVIVFRSADEYSRYALSQNADAYFLCRLSGDSLVLQESQAQNRSILIHEYSHYLMHQDGVKLPVWFFEGMAEIYSIVDEHSSEVLIGNPAQGRAGFLARSDLIPLPELLSMTSSNLARLDRQRAALFYAESWALIHMLKFAPGYRGEFDRFLDLQGKMPSVQATERVWNRSVSTIQADLSRYVQKEKYPALVVSKQSREEQANLVSRYEQLTSEQSELAICRLQSQLRRYTEAEHNLLALSRDHGPDTHIEEELAYLYLERHDYKEAGWHCHQAVVQGSHEARLYVYYARLLEYFQVSADVRASYLEKALELKPDFDEARTELAHVGGTGPYPVSEELAGL